MQLALHEFLYKKNRQQQIKGFYYAAKYLSISEAARSMNLTQSTVTLQIQSLERDLGFQLLKRDSKPLSLTPEGQEFYNIACPLMHEFESVVEKFLDQKKQKELKKVDIAVHHIAISHLMPRIISSFKKSNPQAQIMIRNLSSREAFKRLKENQIDLSFYPNMPIEPEIKQIEVISYDPILIMNDKHPLVTKKIESLKDLREFDLIRIDKNLITLPLFEEAVKTYGIKGSVEFENGNWEILKHFVKENSFVAIVSGICLDKNDNNLIIKNLSQFFPTMSYSVAYKNGKILAPIVQNFLEAILEEPRRKKVQKISIG
ncbi:MAG: LysR family transcriptional regulator [Rickettsiales bacterium]|nr:LysR family transcriptional regulator [Rickettsiales bacterium]